MSRERSSAAILAHPGDFRQDPAMSESAYAARPPAVGLPALGRGGLRVAADGDAASRRPRQLLPRPRRPAASGARVLPHLRMDAGERLEGSILRQGAPVPCLARPLL